MSSQFLLPVICEGEPAPTPDEWLEKAMELADKYWEASTAARYRVREPLRSHLRAAAPAPLTVTVHRLDENNKPPTWTVMLHHADKPSIFDGHQVYRDAIEGRAEYEAACLRAFLNGTEPPFILDFDTDPTTPPVKQGEDQ